MRITILAFMVATLGACSESRMHLDDPCASAPKASVTKIHTSANRFAADEECHHTYYPSNTCVIDGVAYISLGDQWISILFDNTPLNLTLTNLDDADWLIDSWRLDTHKDSLSEMFLRVTPYAADGLVHVTIKWHSGELELKYLSKDAED